MFFLSIGQLHAQKDMEHWIAPYFASTTGYTHGLYFSTDSVTPFTVDIYNNNTISFIINRGITNVTIEGNKIININNSKTIKYTNKNDIFLFKFNFFSKKFTNKG